MNFASKTFMACVLGAFALIAVGADTFPTKPVKIVVPVATGGTSDVLARTLAGKLREVWGQAVVVENKPGASSNLGTEAVVRSAPDGYTLVLQSNSMVANRALGVPAGFAFDKDLTPIRMLGQTPMILVANPALGIKSVKDLVQLAKKDPLALTYGSCGNGTPHHLAMETVKERAGISVQHVPYKGCSPALVDVLGGHVSLAMLSANQVVEPAKSGKVIPLAVSSEKRYAPMPDLPTFEEQGLKDIAFTNWFGLFGPANMPPEIVDKLAKDVGAALNDDGVKATLQGAGVGLFDADGAAVARQIKADQIRYESVVKAAGIKLE
ncbi:MAG: tripartite tricarboxylate transporter substrate binding protein [Variovorax sp.]